MRELFCRARACDKYRIVSGVLAHAPSIEYVCLVARACAKYRWFWGVLARALKFFLLSPTQKVTSKNRKKVDEDITFVFIFYVFFCSPPQAPPNGISYSQG